MREWLTSEEDWFAFDAEYNCSKQTVMACIDMLDSAAKNITPQAHADFQKSERTQSHQPPGFYKLSYLYVKRNDNTVTKNEENFIKCGLPSCEKRSTKHCSKCRRARYCSRDCQKADYKKHKKVCKASVQKEETFVGDRPSALVDPALDPFEGLEGMGSSMGLHTATLNFQGISSSKNSVTGKDKMKHIEGEFVIKIQGGLEGNSPFMMYDEKRIFTIECSQLTPTGKQIKAFLSQHPLPYPGRSPYRASVKCFLFARTESGGLRVFLDTIAPWNTW